MSSEDRTPLHVAASEGNLTALEEILKDPKVEIDPTDELGWTPLMIACSAGKTEIVEALISSGADVNRPNMNGQTALHYAASKAHYKICQILMKNKADVNARDKYGSTPLHRAVSKGNTKIVKMFLSNPNINVNTQDNSGLTPLHCACEEERGLEAKLLIQAGGDITIQDKEKNIPADLCKTYALRSAVITKKFPDSDDGGFEDD